MSLEEKRRKVKQARKRVRRADTKLPKNYPLSKKIRAAFNRLFSLLNRSIKRLNKKAREKRDTGQRIITRKEWGAAPPRSGMAVHSNIVRRVQHHTVYPALSPNASMSEEIKRMRQIQAGHFARGFSDIGYHAVVFPSGRVYEGREARYVGAGVAGYNTGTIHVAADGNYDTQRPTNALVRGCKFAFSVLPGSKTKLYGHRDLEPNVCPGRYLYNRLDEIK